MISPVADSPLHAQSERWQVCYTNILEFQSFIRMTERPGRRTATLDPERRRRGSLSDPGHNS